MTLQSDIGREDTGRILESLKNKKVLVVCTDAARGIQSCMSGILLDSSVKFKECRMIIVNTHRARVSVFNFPRRFYAHLEKKELLRYIEKLLYQDSVRFIHRENVSMTLFVASLLQAIKSVTILKREKEIWENIKSEYLEEYFATKFSNFHFVFKLKLFYNYYVANHFTEKHLNKLLASAQTEDAVCVIWNGRMATSVGAIRICQKLNIRYILAESGSSLEKYELFEKSPHSELERFKKTDRDWTLSLDSELKKTSIATNYLNRVQSDRGFNPFLKTQNESLDSFHFEKRTIVFFPTSGQEFSPHADEIPLDKFQNQYQAFEGLVSSGRFKEYKIFIRSHPQLDKSRLFEKRQDEVWHEFIERYPNFDISLIGNRSLINSYDLARNANLVTSFQSSISHHAICMGIPTLILGPTAWGYLTPRRVAQSKEELILAPIDVMSVDEIASANKYSYYQATRGRRVEGMVFWDPKLKPRSLKFVSRALNWKNRNKFHNSREIEFEGSQ